MPTAVTDFHVCGPFALQLKVGNAYVSLGYTNNEDLASIRISDHYLTFTENDSGAMISDRIALGTSATLSITLTSWDQSRLLQLISMSRLGLSSAEAFMEGVIAPPGSLSVAVMATNDSPAPITKTLAIKLVPTTVGETAWEFKAMLLTSGPEYIDHGNTAKKIALEFATARYYEANDSSSIVFGTTTVVPAQG